MKHAVFHPEASQEYLEAIEYHAAIRVELGERFDSEIQRLVGELSRDPQRFFRFHSPAQCALSRDFPYSVVYLEQPDRVWIVAVMRAERRPGYWKKRLG
ncbi:MAG: type II toxin-antitoxin system RelE/ParE family toxin [Pedosphaera sp.]|nr:type II toxin-antitoxin system RelE/ParE family toxin [Pedosphaera sp.]